MSLHNFRLVAVLYLFMAASVCFAGRSRFPNAGEKVEILKYLNLVNKSPVKSIKSSDGDIIDCVHIHQQPSFDHPLLKNHTIKMKPAFHPNWAKENALSTINASKVGSVSLPLVTQLWHVNGKCPKVTIPIRRTKIEDILRAGSVESYLKKKGGFPVVLGDGYNHEHAVVHTSGRYYGAKATMNVWNPKVQESDEFSLGQLWITSGAGSDLNTIEAGWHVSPARYQDTNTRLFIYWTRNNYQGIGCYNLDCTGFVQTNFEIALGGTIAPTSQVDGSQYDITIRIWKDPTDGRWWMHLGDKAFGYWPSELFSNLDSASQVSWGGEVINDRANGYHTTTQMGSGRFPRIGHGEGEVSYFKNIQISDESGNFKNPEGLSTYTSESNCYDIKVGEDNDWGNFFYYGGPGRNEQCP